MVKTPNPESIFLIPLDFSFPLINKKIYISRFIESLPDLEELETKLHAYYALEKESKG